jgi:hypothetical protein
VPLLGLACCPRVAPVTVELVGRLHRASVKSVCFHSLLRHYDYLDR